MPCFGRFRHRHAGLPGRLCSLRFVHAMIAAVVLEREGRGPLLRRDVSENACLLRGSVNKGYPERAGAI
jgi:hypothetical protein